MSEGARTFIEGIADPLPDGEQVLWRGRPDQRRLARHVFHVRKIVLYFGALVAIRALLALDGPTPLADTVSAARVLAPMCVAVLAIAEGLAWLASRTTIYAITSERVVMRVGMVLPTFFNIPMSLVESASVKRYRDGSGDIVLTLADQGRLSYATLWPHARPWRFGRAEPALRAVPAVDEVGAVLQAAAGVLPHERGRAVAKAAGTVRPAAAPRAAEA